MVVITGFSLVLIAGFFQGSFVLPMTLTKKWEWEHSWGTFSLFGMLIFNWILALLLIPNILSIYQSVASQDIITLILFGAGWGVGAILFGLGMDRLGMALGYPIIMGLIASIGSLIPMLIFFPETLIQARGIALLGGMVITIIGIIFCSRAGAQKNPEKKSSSKIESKDFAGGLIIAIFAGILSCLPNVGMAFGTNVIEAAKLSGVSDTFAGNVVWSLFYTIGFIVNFGYCIFLMFKRKTGKSYFSEQTNRNLLLGIFMAIMWIGSFYLYGMSTAKLGQWGMIVGWPLFISLSIVVGNLWGIWRGEWKDASPKAKALLYRGIIILLAAVIIVGVSNSL